MESEKHVKQSHERRRPPRSLSRILRRTALVEQLIRGMSRQLVLIQAPAGYGKTDVLAAAYEKLKSRETTAWLTFSPDDTVEELTATIAEVMGVTDSGPKPVLEALHRRTAPVYIFLDGAERVAHRRQLLEWLLADPPSSVRLALAGRALPQIRLSPFRLRGLLQEIGAEELAFSREEVRQLLAPWVTPVDLQHLQEMLGSWPALVSLAALILGSNPSPLARAQLLEGRHPALRDFLIEEALGSIGDIGMAILQASAELPNFTFDIAADLAGLPQDEVTLTLFEKLPPLIIGESQQVGWYRMHPLVAQIVPLIAGDKSEDLRRARHIRAATLFAQRGLLEKSVMHACMGADYTLAVETIERAGGVEVFLRVGYTVLQSIVKAVPHDVVRQTPSLRLCRALMLSKGGRIQESRLIVNSLVDETEKGIVLGAATWRAVLEHISSLIDIYADTALDDQGISELAERAQLEQRENTWRLGWLFNHLTIALTRRGDFQAAHGSALNALACYQEEGSNYPQAFMFIHLAFVDLQANRLETALGYCRQAESIIRSRQWNDKNLVAIAHVPLASALYLQGQVSQAEHLLEQAMPVLAQGEGWVDFYVQGYSTLARVRMASSGQEKADEVIQEALAVAQARDLSRLRISMIALRLELLTRASLLDRAERVAHQLKTETLWPTKREESEAGLARARLSLRQGKHEEAGALLERVCSALAETEFAPIQLRAELLRIELCCAMGDTAAALAALQKAAALSAPGQQKQQFLDEGRELARHVRTLVRKVGLRRMSREMADYLSRTATSTENMRDRALLSPREGEILLLLDEGLTNKAIARRLDLTEPTVKFHLKNLYTKLGVSRRQLALHVAKQSGLLSPAS